MNVIQELSGVATSSALDAVRLYFEPIARIKMFHPFFNRPGSSLSRLGRVSLLSASAALILATVWARSEVGIVITDLQGKPNVDIQEPANASMVTRVQKVAGRVTGPERNVWVLVRPANTGMYFVERASVDERGRWYAHVHFGAAGSAAGEEFEIRAIVLPKDFRPPEEGSAALEHMPNATVFSSPVVVVSRK